MAEMVPSVLLYGQALELIKDIQGVSKDQTENVEDLLRELAAVLVRYEESAGKPLVEYESVAETEPPSSEKSNRFWRAAEKDINLLQQQVDILRAATLFSHNAIVTEVEKAYNQNARVGSKLKTLQLYSDYTDSSIVSFGDSFKSLDFIDINQVAAFEQPTFLHEGYVTLGRQGQLVNLSQDANVRVLEGSNGFVGNNQEITDPSEAPTDPETGEPLYTFKAEVSNPNDLESVLDGEPNTWVEYEQYKLTSSQQFSALNMNFDYIVTNDEGEAENVSWADGPSNNVLKLGLEFDIGQIRNLNSVELTPYGLEGNKNYPVLVRRVQTSPNRTDWTTVFPTDVNIGSEVNLKTAAAADNVITRRAVWVFEAREARYVRVYMEQPNPVPTNVGHVYWINRRNTNRQERVEGPNPPIEDLGRFLDDEVVGDFVQRREYFEGQRWAIGIRDVQLQQAQYVQKSVLVTNPLRVGGVVDRVILQDADIQIPPSFPEGQNWVRFFISPDEGENWYPISRIEDVAQDIPEQISFNDPLHESLREGSVKNYTTDSPVTSIRLKIEMRRPASDNSMTPVLHGYTLKVKRR